MQNFHSKESIQVLVVNGAYRGSLAILRSVQPEDFAVTVEIAQGLAKGRAVNNVKYEDVCKVDSLHD